jgi:putative Mg2+ transporter-C (MgtC) family protein
MIDLNESLAQISRLILAALLGAAIGFERESHGQAAGIRTNLLVTVGSCLLMMLSLHMEEIFHYLNANSVVRIDPARIASYAIASMGFLGAGAIIKGKGSVRGLTTAAGLWLVTGIGLAVGAGYFLPAVFSTFLSLLILYGLRRLKHIYPRDVYTILTMTFNEKDSPLENIKKVFTDYQGIHIQFINFKENFLSQTITYRLRLLSKEHLPWGEIVKNLKGIKGLQEISWEEGVVP